MRGVVFTIIAVLLCALQTTLFKHIEFFGATPNLLLAFAICVALLSTSLEGGAIGLLCGILTDIMGYGRFGINSLLFMYICIAVAFLSKNIYRASGIVAFVFTLVIGFTYGVVFFFFAFYIWGSGGFWLAVTQRILPEVVYTAFMSVFLIMLTDYVSNRFVARGA